MRSFPKRLPACALVAALTMAAGCATAQQQPASTASASEDQSAEVKSVTITLPQQALFSIIGFDYRRTDEAAEARKVFQSRAIPLAAEHGFTRHGALIVSGPAVGSYKPQGFLLTSWPDQAAFDGFQQDPRWPEFDALRPSIWHDIRYYRDVQDDGLSLTLRSDKVYTLAIAHIDAEHPGDYRQYLANLESEVAKNGGRFILKLHAPKLESLSGAVSPDQLTLVEWNDAEGIERLLGSEVYAQHRHLLASGTTDFAFFRLRPSL